MTCCFFGASEVPRKMSSLESGIWREHQCTIWLATRVPKVASGPHKSVYPILPPQTLTGKVSSITWARISFLWQLFPFVLLRPPQHSPTRAQLSRSQRLPKTYSTSKEWKPWKSQHLLPSWNLRLQAKPRWCYLHILASCCHCRQAGGVEVSLILIPFCDSVILWSWHLRSLLPLFLIFFAQR